MKTSGERKETKRQWYLKNKEKNKEHDKQVRKLYRENNKEKIKIGSKLYHAKTKDKSKSYNEDNKERLKQYRKDFRAKNWDKVRQREKDAQTKKRKDPFYKLKDSIRNRVRKALKRNGSNKKSKTTDILGCSFDEFKKYIEFQFLPWMDWNNYGNPKDKILEPNKTWDLDHIIPLAKAITEEDLIKLNHYTNFQPLCSYFNRVVKRDL